MIFGAYVGMFIMGVYALVKGKLVLSKNRVLYGAPARVVALFAFLPFPLALCAGVVIGAVYVAAGHEFQGNPIPLQSAGLEFGTIILCMAMIYAVGMPLAGPPREKKPN